MSQAKFETRPAIMILSVITAAVLSGCVTDEELQSKFKPYRIEDRYPLTTKDALAIRRSDPDELCNNWTEDLADSSQNSIAPNHGCAVRVNMAAQLADPTDLDKPNAMTPAPAKTRAAPLDVLDGTVSVVVSNP